jgi:hypothetical protein
MTNFEDGKWNMPVMLFIPKMGARDKKKINWANFAVEKKMWLIFDAEKGSLRLLGDHQGLLSYDLRESHCRQRWDRIEKSIMR